ncbi:TPA: pilus assembly protein [Escherichia coli]|nr:pilus assembly protein [Escherichia coli]
MKLKHVGMIVVSVLAMSSAAVSAAEGDESVTTTVNGGVIHFKGELAIAPLPTQLSHWVRRG